MVQGATLSARWLHEPQPISNQPPGVGVSTPRGAVSTRGSLFSCPGCWICKRMEGHRIRGWGLILTGCGGTLTFPRGATPAARWLHEPQPISNQPVGLGFPHRTGRYRPEGSPFSSPGCQSCRSYGRISDPRMGPYPPRGALALIYEHQPISDRLVRLRF